MRRPLIALPALALLAGCGLLSADLEIPSATITLVQQSFPGVPAGAPLVKDIPFDIGTQLPVTTGTDVTYELRLTQVLVALANGSAMGDFGDIQSVTLSVLPPSGQTVPAEAVIATYAKAPPPADQLPKTISVAGNSSIDLAPYVASGTLSLRLTASSISGLAIPDWTADVGGVFSLKVHAAYGKQL
jgi:hypothetical protein